MSIDEYLVSLYFDFLEQFYALQGIYDEEFDKLFMDDDGNIMTDMEFLNSNPNYHFINELVDEVYENIKSNDEENISPVKINEILRHLLAKYLVFNYDKRDDSVYKYLLSSDFNEIKYMFLNNKFFGRNLLLSNFNSIIDKKKYYENRGYLIKDGKYSDVKNYEYNFKDCAYNYLLRQFIVDFYNDHISLGCSDIEALNLTWYFFTDNYDPNDKFNDLAKMLFGENVNVNYLKIYLLGLIYSDLAEDFLNNSIIQSENYEDRLTIFAPVLMLSLNMICIPNNNDLRNRLLKYFILLFDEKDKRRDNRSQTYIDGRLSLIKRANPYYLNDELEY